VVAVGGGLYLYKKRRDEEEQWAHLDDDWYYQEDEYVPSHPVRHLHTDRPWVNRSCLCLWCRLPKARHLAQHGHLGDVTLADIDKAVNEGKVIDTQSHTHSFFDSCSASRLVCMCICLIGCPQGPQEGPEGTKGHQV
jgi:hypothetical protein